MYDIEVTGYNNKTNKLHLFDIDSVDETIVEDGIAFLNAPENQKYKIMALVSDPQDAAKVCKGVKDVQRLTIGGVRKKAEYITDNLNLTNEDMKALLEVIKTGVEVGMLPTPSDKFVNLEKLLVKALKNQEG